VLLWNSGFVGAEFGLDYAGVFTLLWWRYALLALVLMVSLSARGKLRWPGARPALLTSIAGLFAHGLWLGCVMVSLDAGIPAGVVALVVALQPMTVAALSRRVTGEPASKGSWLGLAIGFTGVSIAVVGQARLNPEVSPLTYLVPFGAVIAFTVASLLQRWIETYSPADHVPVELALLYQSLATALVVAVPALLVEGFSARWTSEFIAIQAWLVLAVSLAAYALMWRLIERMDAIRVASLFYLGPPVTMLMAWLALGDTVETSDLMGLVITTIGVALVYYYDRKHRQLEY